MAAADEPAPRGTFKLTSNTPQRRKVLIHRHSYECGHEANDRRRFIFSDCATRPRPSIAFYLPVLPQPGPQAPPRTRAIAAAKRAASRQCVVFVLIGK